MAFSTKSLHPMKLVVGLGNPGLSYKWTRHNIGSLAVEQLAKKKKASFKLNRSFKSLIAEVKYDHAKVWLILPQTYMNLSGTAMTALLRKKKIPLMDLLVVSDDVALSLGMMRVRTKGGAGGHNGLSSIMEALGTQEFPRLRIGIAEKRPQKIDLKAYVLSRFSRRQKVVLAQVLETSCAMIESWIQDGIEVCMARYNKKQKSN